MSKKTYLSKQIKLITLATYDMFTDEEYELYHGIIDLMNRIEQQKKDGDKADPTVAIELLALKKEKQVLLSRAIASHKGTPRTVRLKNILNPSLLEHNGDNVIWPDGITWFTLKTSRKITEFASAESRALGLQPNDVCLDKIIVKWKSQDVLEQLVMDGFYLPILHEDGSVEKRHFHFSTASAGQLRTDKTQFVSDEAWKKIESKMLCGLTWDAINAKGGINVNKLLAYISLSSGATDRWDNFDIDRSIVIPDFKGPVTGVMKYINPDYTYSIKEHTVYITHNDGIGMMLPSVAEIDGQHCGNFMVRLPFIKGLLTEFDFVRFIKENECSPLITDVWGQQHDILKENITVIFTESQHKLFKYYSSWEHYKQCFRDNDCEACRTNFEEDWIADTQINYQMLQTLNMTDYQIDAFTIRAHNRIEGIATDKKAMLQTLQANKNSSNPYNASLALYPQLLRDGYSRETLKSIKRRWISDAKSGAIKCRNKRLFAIPDMYACCQHWFMGEESPSGILFGDEISAAPFRGKGIMVKRDDLIAAHMDPGACYNDEVPVADVLRSPHLSMEHMICPIVNRQSVYDWFTTNGVYTSCHSLITRRLALDVDGDQLNVVTDDIIVRAALRNLIDYDVYTLYYDMGKAPPEMIDYSHMFHGLQRAHKFSGIGQVSNSLTKLWNKQVITKEARDAADFISMYNNFVIDAAKTGVVNSYEDYPDVCKQVNKAIGGKRSRMPFFFEYSKNGRRQVNSDKSYAAINDSTMNRICKRFMDIGNINMNYANVPPFNWQMMLANNNEEYSEEAVKAFIESDPALISSLITSRNEIDNAQMQMSASYDFHAQTLEHRLKEKFGDIDSIYSSVTKYLFTGDRANTQSHKQTYWRIFGDTAKKNIQANLEDCSVCSKCGAKIPKWADHHVCQPNTKGFFECSDCGTICIRVNSRQTRCYQCQKVFTKANKQLLNKQMYQKKKKRK